MKFFLVIKNIEYYNVLNFCFFTNYFWKKNNFSKYDFFCRCITRVKLA